MMISPGVFLNFLNILIFWVVRGLKGQKKSKMRNNSVARGAIHHDFHLWYTSLKQYLQALFSFFQNFDFLGC